jgi:hypothetical protein
LGSLGVMREGEDSEAGNFPWADDPPPREPFWLAAEKRDEDRTDLDRLADLADQAEAAASRAAAEAKKQLEGESTPTPEDSDRAEVLSLARANLERLARDAAAIARRLRSPGEAEATEPAAGPAESSVSAGTRIVAHQLAARGLSAEEIEARLAEEFGVSDARAIVDEVTGQVAPRDPRDPG